ncbi:hypothetical protein N181_25270 [Sinorhizobium fredii USDA 205]|uniref:Phage tail lysozyme domain-containing protein n=2 Tax=Sinorhizobium TaxID=28105 RepID=A0A844ACQ0_RHIFR|nr:MULTISPECIES: phage tail tip lysozyme [Sinorhizobium]KSV83689.1 hypothetical protein N181_25270 [Sinorhizobium fredii USDA 205]MQX10733.1 hypothetical protein [Sinorhizobium fredii]OAP40357.1 hypothetical protein AU381_00060 [Sinorhizobium glycinis]GEC33561.1 hypothetical protein EFR01_37320 [Sinorhizobium fredii]GLS11862.1 hypothetical protein GCM10007864_54940 [Sinorhizobium fredii]
MAQLASLVLPNIAIPERDYSWLGGIADTLGGAIDQYSQDKSFGKLADLIGKQGGAAPAQQQGGFLSRLAPQQQPQSFAAPVTPVERGQPQGSTYQPFIETVRSGGVTNPYALSAIAATGRAESGFSPKNANRTWSDPSQSGQAGTAGGIMSWRNERLAGLNAYAASKGEQPGNISPQTQAEFFLQEDPQLIAALNNAGSVEEAQNLMNNAWKFAGYDQAGGEAARRRALAQNYFAQEFANASAPQTSADAVNAMAAGTLPAVSGAPLSEEAFTDRFGLTPLPVDKVEGREALAARLAETNAAGAAPAPQPVATPAASPAAFAPVEVADVSGAVGIPGVAPQLDAGLGGITNQQIADLVRDRNTREVGLKLWQQKLTGSNDSAFHFLTAPDGTLFRANKQTGQVDPVGNYGKQKGQYRTLTAEERTQLGIPETDQRVYQVGPEGQISAVGGAGQTINVGNEVEARRQAAAQAGLTPDDPAYQGFILTGKLPRENEQTLTATDKKAILEADEAVMNAEGVIPLLNRALELNDQAYSGPFAGTRGMISGTFGADAGEATLELDNVVTGQALGQLKAIFGGAPTEGERKILLDMSGSSNLPPEVRRGIYQRAMQAVQRRLQTYRDRANELRGGTFYKPESRSNKGNRTQSGVTWEIVE